MNKDKIPAAMYIRMSTEHQKYSPENQAAAIREYAERNGYEIIKTYTDGGKSGLNIAGRAALQQMLKEVQSHQAEYKAILVLDVTRWGRFQDADEEEPLIMSLVENIARRNYSPTELLQGIKQLKDKGYSSAEIARKTGFTAEYINQISKLLFRGEERLINAVYTDRIPLNVAIDISDADDKDVQNVLREAYEAGQIRGNKLAFVKDLIERRIKKGKSIYKKKCSAKQLTAQDVQALYEQEIKRTKLIIAKNDRVENSLIFVTQSIKSLLGNENFYNLLKAEELEKLPKYLAERLQIHG